MEELNIELDTRPGYYYASIRDSEKPDRFGFLAGPFKTHHEALAIVQMARKKTLDLSIWAAFSGFGTCRLPDDFENPPIGKLNTELGLHILNGFVYIWKLTPELIKEAQEAVYHHWGTDPYTGRVGKIFNIDGFPHVVLEDKGDRGLFRPLGEVVSNMIIIPTAIYTFENMEEKKQEA